MASAQTSFVGRLMPNKESSVVALMNGVIEKVYVAAGHPIQPGQDVASIVPFNPSFKRKTIKYEGEPGVVLSLPVKQGKRVLKFQEILSIYDPDNLIINVTSPIIENQEHYIGQPVKIYLSPDDNNHIFEGSIIELGFSNEQNNQIKRQIKIGFSSKQCKAESSCGARLTIGTLVKVVI